MDDHHCGSVSSEPPDSAPEKPKSFLLKLKIAKLRPHVCHFCNKEFSCGKALGGHIRIHVKHNKTSRSKRSKSGKRTVASGGSGLEEVSTKQDTITAEDDETEEDRKIIRCCLCSKEFGSMKSLFGHMRNHPERGWRGIRPPNLEKNSCCSSVSENELAMEVDDQMSCAVAGEKNAGAGEDLFKSFSKWSYVAEQYRQENISDEIPDAAYSLMLLSQSTDKLKINRGKTVVKMKNEQERTPVRSLWRGSFRSGEENPSSGKLICHNNGGVQHIDCRLSRRSKAVVPPPVAVSPRILDFDLNEPVVANFNQV
ncbi:hypothetical protein SLE2022_002430 [Rubroshorea leprosula]